MEQPAFFYDLGSPFAWLAAERVDELMEAAITWVPVLLGGIFKATGRSSWARGEGRAAGIHEVEERARHRGLPALRWPDPWPNNGLWAMRAATYADGCGSGPRFALEAFRVQFVEGVSLELEAGVALAATRAGLDPARVLEAAGDPEVKGRLRENTEQALRSGVVGVPAVLAGGSVFWGDDRLEEAARAVSGGGPDRPAGS